ncbi:hypothetical protein B0H11DRAFT_2221543 [Mycena galericulata]|nr:hypothetical protein B0H11DRAFT_2221543 [Mycena galericulata]
MNSRQLAVLASPTGDPEDESPVKSTADLLSWRYYIRSFVLRTRVPVTTSSWRTTSAAPRFGDGHEDSLYRAAGVYSFPKSQLRPFNRYASLFHPYASACGSLNGCCLPVDKEN